MNRLDLPEYAEDAAILRFYHLDSLDPDVWVDDEESPDNNQEHEKESSIQQFKHPEEDDTLNITTIRPSESDIDLQVIDDSDPLGVYSSIFPEYDCYKKKRNRISVILTINHSEMSRNTNITQLKESKDKTFMFIYIGMTFLL